MYLLKKLIIVFKNPLTVWFIRFFRSFFLELRYKKQGLKIGYQASCRDCAFGNNNVIGDGVLLNNLAIDDYTYIASQSRANNADIGKFCSIGPDVLIGLGKHPARDFVSTHPVFYSPNNITGTSFVDSYYFNEFARVNIGNDVWVGARAIILDGISIGDGAIIAAGSVVTKDVESYSIVGGIPAKKIRNRFNDEEIEFLMQFKWWEKDIEWLRKNHKHFHDIESLISLIRIKKL